MHQPSKKYLKSKYEEANSSPNQDSDPSTTPNSEEQETVKPQQATFSNMAERVQPPLPLNSPPPEFFIVPKHEVFKKGPNAIMCRQYARGMCTRGPNTCVYLHEIILDQLPGVYTFCRNFQNTVCILPRCKFVHATVFEKEHYYRTGYLPPHTLAHLKDSDSALGPPRFLDGPQNHTSQHFIIFLPAMHPGMSSMPLNVAPDGRPNPEMCGPIMRANKREWSETDPTMALPEHEMNWHGLKKCKMCDVSELSLERAKNKLDLLTQEAEMLAKQKQELMKKDARLKNVLDLMLLLMLQRQKEAAADLRSEPPQPVLEELANRLKKVNLQDQEVLAQLLMTGMKQPTQSKHG